MFKKNSIELLLLLGRTGFWQQVLDAATHTLAFMFSFSLVALAATLSVHYFHTRISCVIAAAVTMGSVGLIADIRSKGNLDALTYGTACGLGLVTGFICVLVITNIYL